MRVLNIVLWLVPVLLNAFVSTKYIDILKIDKSYIYIKSEDIKIGMSGALVRGFGQIKEAKIANVEVLSIENKIAKLKVNLDIADFTKGITPKPNISPKMSDKVVMGEYYSRSIAIAPNHTTYSNILSKNKNINWISSDIFAAELFKDKSNKPNKKDFQNFCNTNKIGTLYVSLKSNDYVFDCITFKPILKQKSSLASSDTLVSPFYSRLGDLKYYIFFDNVKKINYDEFYKEIFLLK